MNTEVKPPTARVRRLVPVLLSVVMAASAAARPPGRAWIGSWEASPQRVEPAHALPAEELRNATLRQVIHLSMGGSAVRICLSNRFGVAPLDLSSVHVARVARGPLGAIDPSTDTAVTFSAAEQVTIPAGAEYVSDPVAFAVAPLSDLAITLHLDQPPVDETGHPGSRETSFVAQGDWVSAAELPHPKTIDHWYFISGVQVFAPSGSAAVVALGDSITDGHGSTTNQNNRWTDFLAERFERHHGTRRLAVLNAGMGGNRLLLDGLGPNALARFDRDVLAEPGVRYLIVLEGINDLGMAGRQGQLSREGHRALVKAILGAYQQMVRRAHAHGIEVFGATLLPWVGSQYYHPNPTFEKDRETINRWIRARGHFDGVIDFDRAMRDGRRPHRLRPAFDCGDHLHPSPVGYQAMAHAVPLALFTKSAGDRGGPAPAAHP